MQVVFRMAHEYRTSWTVLVRLFQLCDGYSPIILLRARQQRQPEVNVFIGTRPKEQRSFGHSYVSAHADTDEPIWCTQGL